MLYYERRCKIKSPVFSYFFNIYIASICGYFLTSKISIFQILTTYYAISEIILWGNVYKYSSKKNKVYLMLIFLFLGTIQVLNSFPAYKDLFIPYISTFSKTYRPAMKCQLGDRDLIAFSASFETSTSGGKIGT